MNQSNCWQNTHTQAHAHTHTVHACMFTQFHRFHRFHRFHHTQKKKFCLTILPKQDNTQTNALPKPDKELLLPKLDKKTA